MESELVFIGLGLVTLAAICFGSWQANNLWAEKASSITRKELRGRLYWVVEDGDTDKLNHIVGCFEGYRQQAEGD